MVFGVGQLNYLSQIWLRLTLVAMVTKICDFQYKIGDNLPCAGGTALMLACSRGFQDRPIKRCQSNFAQTTPVAMVTKIYQILTKFAITFACTGDMSPILAQNIGFSGSANLTVQTKFVSHNPCCHSNENFEILTGNLP